MDYPKDVLEVRRILRGSSDLEDSTRLDLLERLTPSDRNTDQISMWRALEKRRTGCDELWVYAFLEVVQYAYTLPPYFFLPPNERRDLRARAKRLSEELSGILKTYELDRNIVHLDGINFGGWYSLEDFSIERQDDIRSEEIPMIPASQLIAGVVRSATNALDEVDNRSQGGEGAEMRRFIRVLAERNEMRYGKPLNKVVATAASTLFDAPCSESRVAKLRNR